jgi:hypothetical protein
VHSRTRLGCCSMAWRLGRCGVYPHRRRLRRIVRSGIRTPKRFKIQRATTGAVHSAKGILSCSGLLSSMTLQMALYCLHMRILPLP